MDWTRMVEITFAISTEGIEIIEGAPGNAHQLELF